MPQVKLLVLIPFLVLCWQLYNFAIRQKTEEKQKICRHLGIAACTLGVASLMSRDFVIVSGGLILMMFGFRLIAHGLDRLDKKIFIDRSPPPD